MASGRIYHNKDHAPSDSNLEYLIKEKRWYVVTEIIGIIGWNCGKGNQCFPTPS